MKPDVNQINDNELLSLVSQGDKKAFDLLYEKYWKLVFNTAFKRLGDIERSKDVAQDVFVQLWARATSTPILNLGAYLRISARNAAFRHLENSDNFEPLSDKIKDIISGHDRADNHILYREFLKAFQELLKTLPPQQQQIFEMRFNEGLSTADIADKLNISVKTVRNQIGRSLNTLRKSLFVIYLLMIAYNR